MLVVVGMGVMPVTAQAGQVAPESGQAAPPRSVGPSAQELRHRLDSLAPLLSEARADVDRQRALEEESRRRAAAAATRVDTLAVGPLTVLTPSGQAEATRELFSGVWEEHFADLGHSPALERSTFAYQRVEDEPLPIHVEGGGHVLYRDAWLPTFRVEASVRSLIAGAMSHDLRESGSLVSEWAWGNALDAEPLDETYRRIAIGSARANRGCLAGDTSACASALGLGDASGPELAAEWYTPRERQARVARHSVWRSRRAQVLRAQCREDDLSACDEYMEHFGWNWAPMGQEIRESVLAYALDRGGQDAWTRLLEDPEMTPQEALEHASGESLDELLAGWHGELVANRPETFEALGRSSGRAFLWTLLFAALALRSTRWRLG